MKKTNAVLKVILCVACAILLVAAGFVTVLSVQAHRQFKDMDTETVHAAPMKFDTYGNPENPSVLLMHGMYMDGSMLSYYGTVLSSSYYVIIPTFHGMEGASQTVFKSFDGECEAIEAYVKENLAGKLDYAYGISMGATAIYHILQRGNISLSKAILDGLYVANQGAVAAYMTCTSYYKFHQELLAGQDFDLGMMKIGFKLMGMGEDEAKAMLRDDMTGNAMTFANMSRAAYANYTYQVDVSAHIEDTVVAFWCGSKEPYAIKSNRIAKPHVAHYTERIFENLAHGEFVSKHKEECAKQIASFFR